MPKPLKKKAQKDENELAHALVQRLSGHAEPVDFATQYKAHMAKLGAKGGKIGGKRRLETMTPKQRSDAASKAARVMWAKRKRTKAR